jgi:hypothetical protein
MAANPPGPDVVPTLRERSVPQRQEDARSRIAFVLIALYVVLLLANIGVPVGLYLSSGGNKGPLTISDMKDMTLAISAALGSLVGILGVVVGFYFKSWADAPKKKA